jgi:DNA-directed RNA polymerase subunit H (RpoH/RPB5)
MDRQPELTHKLIKPPEVLNRDKILENLKKYNIREESLPILENGLKVYLEQIINGLSRVSREAEAIEEYKSNRFYKQSSKDNQNVGKLLDLT